MKKIFLLLFVTLLGNPAIAQITDYSIFDKKFNFYVPTTWDVTATMTKKPLPNSWE